MPPPVTLSVDDAPELIVEGLAVGPLEIDGGVHTGPEPYTVLAASRSHCCRPNPGAMIECAMTAEPTGAHGEGATQGPLPFAV